eukprot:CAMPEP_0197681986 /NCGR_PEP_ID=MMETSP1338-20131121/95793_1 /TAXON_ID=43686 ORGANISM="Pelagodinium beii, Strain RCC1491" /NCGR_SAMPLE_ID=MMETSP1338 /ASSEMBLY_ACC=CAM_ASM_000754 /LENGTH=178 /DNA_ID=CAMNT_0043263399 /DNA_START=99 /DNA_END=631 /DNA_ORIENTATION=-
MLDLTKTSLCKRFATSGCADKECPFAHGMHELRATERFFKTVMCKHFQRGVCRAGSGCRHAHDISELRAQPTKLDDSSGCEGEPRAFSRAAEISISRAGYENTDLHGSLPWARAISEPAPTTVGYQGMPTSSVTSRHDIQNQLPSQERFKQHATFDRSRNETGSQLPLVGTRPVVQVP